MVVLTSSGWAAGARQTGKARQTSASVSRIMAFSLGLLALLRLYGEESRAGKDNLVWTEPRRFGIDALLRDSIMTILPQEGAMRRRLAYALTMVLVVALAHATRAEDPPAAS